MLTFTRDCSIYSDENELNPDIIAWDTMQVNKSGSDVRLEYLSFKRKEKLLFSASCKATAIAPTKAPKHKKGILVCEDDMINVQFA